MHSFFSSILFSVFLFFFFFNDTATTEIYTLSLHDALPIWVVKNLWLIPALPLLAAGLTALAQQRHRRFASSLAILSMSASDRKSTRLNSSHGYISYAVFCLKKKKKKYVYDNKVIR